MDGDMSVRGTVPAENPVTGLVACHAEIQHHCSALEAVARQRDPHDGTAAKLQAAVAYFDNEVLHHHVIEERELFARLVALPATVAGSAEVISLVEALRVDHRLLESMWASLRPMLQEESSTLRIDLRTYVYSFITSYRHHMKREETGIFPMVGRLLDRDALKAIVDAMKAPHSAGTNGSGVSPHGGGTN